MHPLLREIKIIMGRDTDIQWCDSTVNPTGFQCDGCELWQPKAKPPVKKCYAGRWSERVGGAGAFDKPIELKPGRMAEAARWSDLRGVERKDKPWIPAAMPRLVFIGDMADTFSTGVPFEYLKTEVIDVVRSWPHIGLWLTKRPKRMAEFSQWLKATHQIEWPQNLWVGTSVTSADKLHRIKELQYVGELRFVSFEPLLGETDFTALRKMLFTVQHTEFGKDVEVQPWFQWAIPGGESGAGAGPTDLIGMLDLVHILEMAEIKTFVKQLGKIPYLANVNVIDLPDDMAIAAYGTTAAGVRLKLTDPKGGDWTEWPDEFKRREFPEVV